MRPRVKAAEKVGMISDIVHLNEDTSEEDVLKEVERLNNDDNVHGILVQIPLPEQVDENKVPEAISPDKDVGGFSAVIIYTGERTFVPCTPLAIMDLLKHTEFLEGKEVAVIGRS